ncbi:hypothetical protein ACFL6C_00585 [Myxococcota bacterium]
MKTTSAQSDTNLKKLYESLSPEAQEAIDQRAMQFAMIEDAEATIDGLDKGEPISFNGGLSWGWRHVEQALNEAIGQVKQDSFQTGQDTRADWQQRLPKADGGSYDGMKAQARFLYDQGQLGEPKYDRPPGDLVEVGVAHDELAAGVKMSILVDKGADEAQFYVHINRPSVTLPPQDDLFYGPLTDTLPPIA